MPNSKPKRLRPRNKADRRRLAEINTKLNRGRLVDDERAELEAERDRLAPVLMEVPRPDGSPLEESPDADSNPSVGSPVSSDIKPDAKMTFAKKLDAAKRAIEPQIKAKVLHIDDTVTNVAEAHAKFGRAIWSGSDDWDSMEHAERVAFTTFQLRIWRKAPLFDRPTWADASWEHFLSLPAAEKLRLRQEFDKLNLPHEQWHKIFDQLGIEKRMREVMRERYFAASEAAPPSVENVAPAQLPHSVINDEHVPSLDPIAAASANLSARAALLLKNDSWLSRLAEHSPEMRTRILAGLTQELLRAGFAAGDFCARLYNELRPKAVADFPERRF